MITYRLDYDIIWYVFLLIGMIWQVFKIEKKKRWGLGSSELRVLRDISGWCFFLGYCGSFRRNFAWVNEGTCMDTTQEVCFHVSRCAHQILPMNDIWWWEHASGGHAPPFVSYFFDFIRVERRAWSCKFLPWPMLDWTPLSSRDSWWTNRT